MKKRFCFDDYDSSDVMICQTREDAESFMDFLHESGYRWSDGGRYSNNKRYYDEDDIGTGYRFKLGYYSSASYYLSNTEEQFNIVYYDDFEWGDDAVSASELTYDQLFD